MSCRNNEEYDKALVDFQKANTLNGNFALCYISMGITYKLMEKYLQAIESFNQAINMEPGHADWYINRAEVV